jgi:hypothetical protein
MGWSHSAGTGSGIPGAVLRSHAVTSWLAGQGGGSFGLLFLIFRGGRSGANVGQSHELPPHCLANEIWNF